MANFVAGTDCSFDLDFFQSSTLYASHIGPIQNFAFARYLYDHILHHAYWHNALA